MLLETGDAEGAEAFDWLVGHRDMVDAGARWPVTTPRDHGGDRVIVALEDRLDGSVVAVADPTVDADPRCLALTRVPEEHALHPAGGDHTPSDHAGMSA